MRSAKEDVRRLFSGRAAEWASWYDDVNVPALETDNLLTRQRAAAEMIAAAVPLPARILDVGCGTGDMAARLMRQGYEVSGVDIAEPMVTRARERWGADRFEVGDSEHLPFPDNSFDAVVCLGVMEYQDTDEQTLSEIRRVLKPGGHAVISTPSAISPLYHMDRAVLAAETAAKPIFYLLRYRLRGRPVPADRPVDPAIRRYHRRRWFRRLRSAGLEPEDWICRGWGWYKSRLGSGVAVVARHARRVRQGVARLVGDHAVSSVKGALMRNSAVNWMGREQMVRVRAIKN